MMVWILLFACTVLLFLLLVSESHRWAAEQKVSALIDEKFRESKQYEV